jgi:hypothetical protein
VQFVEVFQFGVLRVDGWYEMLNLGLQLAPSAGSDYPWGDVPGRERTYVRVGPAAGARAWHEGLVAGRSFVTNGPLLEISLASAGPGDRLPVPPGAPLVIQAHAIVNPDLGVLESLELVRDGEVVVARTGATAERLALDHVATMPASGSWWALRARGTNGLAAHSAPIYVLPQGGETVTGDCARALAVIERAVTAIEGMAAVESDWSIAPQNHATSASRLRRKWQSFRPDLARRIGAAREWYARQREVQLERCGPEQRRGERPLPAAPIGAARSRADDGHLAGNGFLARSRAAGGRRSTGVPAPH